MRSWLCAFLFACTTSTSSPDPCASKPEHDMQFRALLESSEATVSLSDWYAPCATRREVLLLRVVAGWCGSCLWQAQHTQEILGDRVELVDVLLSNEDNVPARVEDLASFRKWIVKSGPRVIVADPTFQVSSFLPERLTLPAIVVLDRKTMKPIDVITDPDTDVVKNRVAIALAKLDGTTPPAPIAPVLVDDRFPKWQVDMMREMTVPGTPPPDPSNAKADDPAAAMFGELLFSDSDFSPNGKLSCSSCHIAGKSYTDGLPTSIGLGPVDRNAPSITLASHTRWAFWDGRADSLWSQALGPIEASNEIGSSRLRVAHHVYDAHRSQYESIFGPMPDMSALPADGKPKDPTWESMSAQNKDAIDRVFSNVGKAIEAHERTLRVQPNALDKYIAGDLQALTSGEKDGLRAFFDVGCAQCHWGPRLTDDAFHSLRFPTGRVDGAPDRGRIDAIAALDATEFGKNGTFSDAKSATSLATHPSMLGAFKTPTLRALPVTAPYGHGGTFATLEEIVAIYARGGDANDPHSVGTLEPWLVKFDEKRAASLVLFMRALGGIVQN